MTQKSIKALPSRVRVLVADDHVLLRMGLRELLRSQRELEVVGEAQNGEEAVRLAEELSTDLVVMDINMPRLNGVEATRRIRSAMTPPKVIALSVDYSNRLVGEMLDAGACGYVLKESAFEELLSAVHAALEDSVYLSPRVSNGFRGRGKTRRSGDILSGREREVLVQIAEGKNTKQISHCLKVSVKTVETHRRNTMDKLRLDSVATCTKFAIREGMTGL